MQARITVSSRPAVETKRPRAQKCWPTKFRFLSPYTRARCIALLPLMYPTTCDTAYFGGVEIISRVDRGRTYPSRKGFKKASNVQW